MEYRDILKVVLDSEGVSIDTRTLRQGQVYFALKGDNFDGNNFVPQAIDKGAKTVVASDEKYKSIENVIVVDDTLLTLQKIANLHRKNYDIDVVAITGTNGKTTTKEFVTNLLSAKYNILSTVGNFNNHIGLPITLLNLNERYDMVVVEMGASSKGEIKFLCEIAEPTHGLITSIGKAHISGFGSVENIIDTKLELFDYIYENDGVFFLNESVEAIAQKLKGKDSVIRFSNENMKGNLINKLTLKNSYPFIDIEVGTVDDEDIEISTMIYGEYNFVNITNAIKIADYFKVDMYKAFAKFKVFKLDNNRSQIVAWNGNKVILDAYNANPTSVLEALKSFCSIKTEKNKVVILGDMLELGEVSLFEHAKIIEYLIGSAGLSAIYLIGQEYMGAISKSNITEENIYTFANYEEAKEKLLYQRVNDSVILAKGSRGIKVEKIFL